MGSGMKGGEAGEGPGCHTEVRGQVEVSLQCEPETPSVFLEESIMGSVS